MKKILIKNNRISLVIVGATKLMPKVNQITELELKELKKFKNLFEGDEPTLELLSEDYEIGGKDESDINSYPKRQAAKIIKETVDMRLLNKWAKECKEESVVNNIKKQIEKIEKTMTDKVQNK